MDKLIFCGDFCLAEGSIGSHAYTQGEIHNPWRALHNQFGKDGCIIANIEASVTHRKTGRPFKWANLRIDPIHENLFNGLDLAILGNNHVGDFGVAGAIDTINYFNTRHILHTGIGDTLDEAIDGVLMTCSGVKIAVISLCCPSTNSEFIATHQSSGVAPLGIATLHKAIIKAKKKADLVVIYAHWGCEWVHDPSPDQVRMGRYAIDLGADAVVGCHSHTIQSYENYKDKWIFYGLGNYLFDGGYAQALQDDGSLKKIPLRLVKSNRESLVVSLIPKSVNGCCTFELEKIQAYCFDESFNLYPIEQGELSFDISAANKRLHWFVSKNKSWVHSTDEPEYISRLLNGSAMAYWYRYPSFDSIANISAIYCNPNLPLIKRVLLKLRNLAVKATSSQ